MWEDLSIKEKSELIKQATKNGISGIEQIRDAYNNSIKQEQANAMAQLAEEQQLEEEQDNDYLTPSEESNYAEDNDYAEVEDIIQEAQDNIEAERYAYGGELDNSGGMSFEDLVMSRLYGDGDKLNSKRKFEGGGILGGAIDDETQEYLKLGASLIPGVGLGIDAYDFYKEPTWENAGWLAASTLSTALGAGALVRSAKMARRAEKAKRAFEKAQSLEKHFHKALRSNRAARNKKYYDRTLNQWSNYNKNMIEKKNIYRSAEDKADWAKVISTYAPMYVDVPIFLEQGASTLTRLNNSKNK